MRKLLGFGLALLFVLALAFPFGTPAKADGGDPSCQIFSFNTTLITPAGEGLVGSINMAHNCVYGSILLNGVPVSATNQFIFNTSDLGVGVHVFEGRAKTDTNADPNIAVLVFEVKAPTAEPPPAPLPPFPGGQAIHTIDMDNSCFLQLVISDTIADGVAGVMVSSVSNCLAVAFQIQPSASGLPVLTFQNTSIYTLWSTEFPNLTAIVCFYGLGEGGWENADTACQMVTVPPAPNAAPTESAPPPTQVPIDSNVVITPAPSLPEAAIGELTVVRPAPTNTASFEAMISFLLSLRPF